MTSLVSPQQRPLRIAIVGGGFSGCCAAAALSTSFEGGLPTPEITLFDMGGRGVGGRSSHRRVRVSDSAVLPDDEPAAEQVMEFDHGAQFFRARSPSMKRLARHWVRRGWAAEWRGRFGRVSGGGISDSSDDQDFFGCPPPPSEPLYVGVGGMQTICRRIMDSDAPGVTVRHGVRVARVERLEGAAVDGSGGGWRLHGTSGRAALHDTPEEELSQAEKEVSALDDETYDLVLMTDVSSSFGSWHRASAGLQEPGCPTAPIAAKVGSRPRVPLFTSIVAFRRGAGAAGAGTAFDAFTVTDSEILWFAARNNSKPSFPEPPSSSCCPEELECWTLVSTAAFAVAEISEVNMQDEAGTFMAQDPAYLNGPGGPSNKLLNEFRRVVGAEDGVFDDVFYLQGQRWGSALPQPVRRLNSSRLLVRVMHVDYDPKAGGFVPPPRHDAEVGNAEEEEGMPYYYDFVPESTAAAAATTASETAVAAATEFEQDEALGFYYCGDFCSRILERNPGVEAACLSGVAAAAAMAVACGWTIVDAVSPVRRGPEL
mmetsp:Transcript_17998/g.46657  ORF Transcript_17998/g.46657 Transcript_17998/m.46657 type:complete len:541 (-) Transcript_17998:297-1919(-)